MNTDMKLQVIRNSFPDSVLIQKVEEKLSALEFALLSIITLHDSFIT